MSKVMYVYNIAVKRPGKEEVECDSMISEKVLTYDDVKEMSVTLGANVMFARVGRYLAYDNPPKPIYASSDPVIEEVQQDGIPD